MPSKRTMKKPERHFFYISLLNVISALSVVMLHANGAFWHYREGRNWAVNNVIECVFYFAVPIFFMLTGATLFDYQKRYDTKTFFKRRFTKIIIPFVVWSIFGVFYYSVIQGNGWDLNLSNMFNALVSGSYVGIFWFFPPLICIYLAIPLMASIEEKKKMKVMQYIAVVGLILNIVVPFLIALCNRFLHTTFEWPYAINFMSGYILYSVIGYLLHNYKLVKKQRLIIYALAIIGLLVHIVGTYILSRRVGHVDMLFKEYLNLPCMLYSVGIFVFFKQLANSKKLVSAIKRPVLFLQKYTFAIYLLHSFAISEFIKFSGLDPDRLLYVILAFVFTVPVCVIITFLIRKIPKVGKYILP